MMTLEVNTEDLKRLANKLSKDERDKAIRVGMMDSGNVLKHWIMRERLSAEPGYSPNQLHAITGRLRTSIGAKIADGIYEYNNDTYTLRIGTNVQYAPKHEYGIGVRPRPFMSASIEDRDNQNEILRLIELALQTALDKE